MNTHTETTHYSLALAKKSLLTAVIFALVGVAVLKAGPLCSKVIAACTESPTQPQIAQIAPQYFHFSETELSKNIEEKKAIVLYFHAPWCTSCTSFDEELRKQTHQLPENVTVLQIPYDTSPELKQRYGVVYQHTLVLLDESANTKEMWIGGDLKSLLEYLKKNS